MRGAERGLAGAQRGRSAALQAPRGRGGQGAVDALVHLMLPRGLDREHRTHVQPVVVLAGHRLVGREGARRGVVDRAAELDGDRRAGLALVRPGVDVENGLVGEGGAGRVHDAQP
jgi:hypothetical protein